MDKFHSTPVEAAFAEIRATFPSASFRLLWSATVGPVSLAVVDVQMARGSYTHQVVSLQESPGWFAWTSGEAPGWLEVDPPLGIMTCILGLEVGTSDVMVSGTSPYDLQHVVDNNLLIRARWNVAQNSDWNWPDVVKVRVHGEWFLTALPNIPLRMSSLVARLIEMCEHNEGDNDTQFFAAFDEAIDKSPKDVWKVMKSAILEAHNDEAIVGIASGPLEDLLVRHRRLIQVDVETSASESAIRRALGAVWSGHDDQLHAWLETISEGNAD